MSRRSGPTGSVYLEYYPVGQQIKVSAIDAATGVEVSVFGPKSASQEDLKQLAIRKLTRRLEQLAQQ
ncbi:conserved hypothetical protein [Roseibium sp. TrichSKD4]|uniref:DUF6898 family protein n=1 Tax=Roseibium sp. TrichSKD4 TaxID=744980 RepID=UPI0001E56F5A|nr:serine hydroxymethyltransferase [Roseibium sp. TrichSKD4]EFO30365.1 conserved hypothetical protein [Roseibium sp. TrichSKD4]